MLQPFCAGPRPAAALLCLLCLAVGAARADSAAATKAQTLIDLSPLLNGYDIRVLDGDGRLRLEGAVADASERELAAALAAVATDGAEVDNALRAGVSLPETSGELFSTSQDLTTAARLRQRLRWQRNTAPLDIEIDVEAGAVHLNGTVGTTTERERIATLAATTEGVQEVFDYISVDPERIPAIRERQAAAAATRHPDAWIASRLRRLLQFDTTVNADRIEVDARNGTAVLSGTVTSSAERKVAETLAEQLPGVTGVDSRLIIEEPL
jgi:osmotically-inducible protein OsmY